MRLLTLNRFCSGEQGTFGTMMVDGANICTVERQWLDNRQSVSCIPNGSYLCKARPFFRGGYDAIEVCDVPGRSYILFHKGNRAQDVQGCIAVGSRLGCLYGDWAVLDSGPAFDRLMNWFNRENRAAFELDIRWSVG